MELQDKKILLAVTGSIAAYKTAELIRLLKEQGAQIRVVMSQGAEAFIPPLTLQALSGEPVRLALFDAEAEQAMSHIHLAKWADAILVAPATAQSIAKLAIGLADDLISTVCLASTAPLFVAPAMNQQMWAHAATVSNVATLVDRGVTILGPNSGLQACGDTGLGRMQEPAELVLALQCLFQNKVSQVKAPQVNVPKVETFEDHVLQAKTSEVKALEIKATQAKTPQKSISGETNDYTQTLGTNLNLINLKGKRVLITAGPTREPIDPVRYLSNRSSGKMGFALASVALQRGANVTLVTGPVSLPSPHGVQRIDVVSAEEMYQAVMQFAADMDIVIAAAAVADFTVIPSLKKFKKSASASALELLPTRDIIAAVSALNWPYTVAFAAETHDLLVHAREKRLKKRVNMIIANDVSETTQGMDSDFNAVTVITEQREIELTMQTKQVLAENIWNEIEKEIEKEIK